MGRGVHGELGGLHPILGVASKLPLASEMEMRGDSEHLLPCAAQGDVLVKGVPRCRPDG